MLIEIAALALASQGLTLASAQEPPTVFAKDSVRAANMEVDDPATMICVRRRMTNSRTRYTKTCLTSDQWKSFELEKQAQAQDMKNSAKGYNLQ